MYKSNLLGNKTHWIRRRRVVASVQMNEQIEKNDSRKKQKKEKIMKLKQIEQKRFSNDMTGCEITHVVVYGIVVEK